MVSGDSIQCAGSTLGEHRRKRGQEERERLRQLESDFAHINRVSMMGELAASLSHEIMQPIASARINACAALNFLDKQPPDLGEVRQALARVVGESRRHRRSDSCSHEKSPAPERSILILMWQLMRCFYWRVARSLGMVSRSRPGLRTDHFQFRGMAFNCNKSS